MTGAQLEGRPSRISSITIAAPNTARQARSGENSDQLILEMSGTGSRAVNRRLVSGSSPAHAL